MHKIRLVIVDDELTARNTIKSFLAENPLYCVAADFQDAKSALQWLRENEIEIMLCDMQMPTINGLELLRLVRACSPDMVVIAISGFDNFEYTRGCMVEGAADYLLKNGLTREKLLHVLDTVRERYQICPEENHLRHLSGYCIPSAADFTAEHLEKMVEHQEIAFDVVNVCPVVISPDYRYLGSGSFAELQHDLCKAMNDMIAQILGTEYPYVVYITPKRHLMVLLSFKGINSILYVMNSTGNFCARIRRSALRLLDMTLTIGTGSPQPNLEKAIEQSRQLDLLSADKLYLGGDRVFTMQTAQRIVPKEHILSETVWKQLEYVLSQADGLGVQAIVQDIFAQLRENNATLAAVQATVEQLLQSLQAQGLLTETQQNEAQHRFAYYEMLEPLYTDMQALIETCLRSKKTQQQYSSAVAKAQDYIRQNYARDISLQDCADYAGASYTNLSRVFRQETGMRFVEYLNQVRLSIAKSLLIRQNISMKEIVEQVGFRNYNYFFKVFRENENLTPSEFLAKNCSKS